MQKTKDGRWTVFEKTPHIIKFKISGEDVNLLDNESGNHRIQRIPPTERKGRVHTSHVTVAVLPEHCIKKININPNDLRVEWYSGSGAGGQHRNKHMNSCRLTHIPTGIIKTAQTRDRKSSMACARESLLLELQTLNNTTHNNTVNTQRISQVGDGGRSNWCRTYCFQHGIVKDKRTGKQITIKQFEAGSLQLLWC